MGGFTLKGPTHTIVSTAPIRCRCIGYSSKISQEVQDFLMQKRDPVLVLSELPQVLRDDMQKHHLSDDMKYEVRPNIVSTPYVQPVYNPNVY